MLAINSNTLMIINRVQLPKKQMSQAEKRQLDLRYMCSIFR